MEAKDDVSQLFIERITDAAKHVIFFPGDIQDLTCFMERSPEASEWKDYSLENTIKILDQRYSNERCNFFIIKPARQINLSSEYDNLLRPGQGVLHLSSLIQNCLHHINKNLGYSYASDTPICLLAFSKGSLVVNHLLAELATAMMFTETNGQQPACILDWDSEMKGKKLPHWEPSFRIARTRTLTKFVYDNVVVTQIYQFFNHVCAIHWIDGHRFPTEPHVVQHIAKYVGQSQDSTSGAENKSDELSLCSRKTAIKFYTHGTPRQLDDHGRKWIRQEYDTFLERMKENSATVNTFTYFDDEPRSLENHFKVLKVFNTESK